jgi:hypothetical protein
MRLFHSFLCLFAAHLSAAEVIHHQADASETTKWAARELQRLVLAATGEKLAVVSENTTQAAIRLVADDALPRDGFVIRTEKDDVAIAGNESTPAGLWSVPSHGPAAAQHNAWGARMVGHNAWGVNAPVNYLLARQMWNPKLDVSAALDEWLARAYGPGWRHMRALYDALDIRMAAHKKAQPPVYAGSQWELNEEVMKAVHAPLFSAMEQFYRATLAECTTDTQKGLYRDSRGIDHGPLWKGEWRAP